MSDDLTAAPERVWLGKHPKDKSWEWWQGLWNARPFYNAEIEQFEYVRADLCAPVDAEGAAREIVDQWTYVPIPSAKPEFVNGIAEIIRKHQRDNSAEVTRLQVEVERLTAAWCLCGHTKKQHDSYCDHDECNGCIHESRDEPCSWFSPNTEERTNG